jgi:hypothetical protein
MKQKLVEPEAFQYGQTEAALADLMGQNTKEARKAFRARLRHMRNIGVPCIPKIGSGRRIAYTKAMILEMLLTLRLERAGFPPRVAALAAPKISELSTYANEGEDAYVFVGTPEEGGFLHYAKGDKALLRMAKSVPNPTILLKLSELLRELDKALEKVAAG